MYRYHSVDIIRGIACLSMPFYHTLYNLYTTGLTDTLWTQNTFWFVYQKAGLSTFVFVSGMAFVLSTQQGIRWPRLLKRMLKLGSLALCISAVTYLIMPERFVRFGVLHFFTATILLAPLFRWHKIAGALIGLSIVIGGIIMTKAGLFPNSWLYITGLMSQRPPSIDYIPLVPWFGVFLLGMTAAQFLKPKRHATTPSSIARPFIWLGQHSLVFYFAHQAAIFVVLSGIAWWINR